METNDSIQRRIKANQMQRNLRRSELTIKRVFVLIRFIMILAILALTWKLVTSSHWYVNKSAFDSPQNAYLKILGNEITPNYKILNALRKVPLDSKPIYMVNTDKMADEVMKIDPIKRVYVRRFWFPGRFTVIVEERKPLIMISPSATVPPIAFFTEEGTLIGREYLPLKKKYPTTLVLTYGTRGDDYRHWKPDKIKTLDKLAKNISLYAKEKVLYIDLRKPKDVYVQLPSARLRLGDLDYSVFKRIESINSILPKIEPIKQKIKYVDLRWEDAKYLKLEYNNAADENKADKQVIED